MSRLGSKPITIPENTEVVFKNNIVSCKGKNGILEVTISPLLSVNIDNTKKIIIINRKNDSIASKSIHGTTRKLVINSLKGINDLYEKKLEIIGIGYRVKLSGKNLELGLGYSHPIIFKAPDGINFKVVKNTITISGANKQLVGQVAANIRALKKPEPYKGKGIKYIDEIIKRKAGKTAKTSTSTK